MKWNVLGSNFRSEEKRKSEMEMARSSAEKEEERLLGEIKLAEHLRREEDKDQEYVSCVQAMEKITSEPLHQSVNQLYNNQKMAKLVLLSTAWLCCPHNWVRDD